MNYFLQREIDEAAARGRPDVEPVPRVWSDAPPCAMNAPVSRPPARVPAAVWSAIAAVALARVLYQLWLSPYELVADEAQYWDWSRRLDWSYYSKGPGVAWLIAASTRLFGISEWSVRLPAAIAFGIASAAIARLAVEQGGDRRDAMRAALLVSLVPAYQLSALLMTIDAPYIACWAIATWAAWRLYRGERDGRPSSPAWIACAVAIGVGFLFKYTMLLFVPGLLVLAWLERRNVSWRAARTRALAGIVVTTVFALPVFIWNVRHDAAGLGHLLGYLAVAGGDRPARAWFEYHPAWTASYVGSQLAIIGPALALIVLAVRDATRDPGAREAVRFALCLAAPMLLFFFAASLRAPVEGNWPIAAYAGLLPAAALTVGRHAQGPARRWWRVTVAYGVAALVAIHAPLVAARVPVAGRYVPVHRFTGSAAAARALSEQIVPFVEASGGRALIVAPSHNLAGLLAFYLPGHPRVASAGWYLGDRPSSYDFFPDVSLGSALTRGRPAILLGNTASIWTDAFDIADLTRLSPFGPEFATKRLGAPRHAPRPAGDVR